MGSGPSKDRKQKRSEKKDKTKIQVNGPEQVEPGPPALQPEPTGHVITNREIQDAISRGNNFCTFFSVYCFRDICVTVIKFGIAMQ